MKKILTGLSNNITANKDKIKVWSESFRRFSDGDVVLIAANATEEDIATCIELDIKYHLATVDELYYIKSGTRSWGMTHKINTLEDVTYDALVDTFGKPNVINRVNLEAEWNITFEHEGVNKFCRIYNNNEGAYLKDVTSWIIGGSLESYGVGEIYKHLIRNGHLSSNIFS